MDSTGSVHVQGIHVSSKSHSDNGLEIRCMPCYSVLS